MSDSQVHMGQHTYDLRTVCDITDAFIDRFGELPPVSPHKFIDSHTIVVLTPPIHSRFKSGVHNPSSSHVGYDSSPGYVAPGTVPANLHGDSRYYPW